MAISLFDFPVELLLNITDRIRLRDLLNLAVTSQPIRAFLDEHYRLRPPAPTTWDVVRTRERFGHIATPRKRYVSSRVAHKHLTPREMTDAIMEELCRITSPTFTPISLLWDIRTEFVIKDFPKTQVISYQKGVFLNDVTTTAVVGNHGAASLFLVVFAVIASGWWKTAAKAFD